MQTFVEWTIDEQAYVLDKKAHWGIAVPTKNKDGFKLHQGETHPTATCHDHLAKEHYETTTNKLLKNHPGSVRYLSQHDPDTRQRTLHFELTSHPKSTETARKMISHPKHSTVGGAFGGRPGHYQIDFHDKPHKNFDTEYADEPVKHTLNKLKAASES